MLSFPTGLNFTDNNQFMVTLDIIFKNLPVNAYFKSYSGINLWCNRAQLKACLLNDIDEFIGTTAYDLCDEESAEIVTQNDNFVLQNFQTLTTIEKAKRTNDTFVSFNSTKKTVVSMEGNLVGLFGIAIPINQSMNDKNSFFKTLQSCGLSTKETNCAYYLYKGKTAKEIAKITNNSYRTIQKHIEHIRYKLQCTSRSQLILLIDDMLMYHQERS